MQSNCAAFGGHSRSARHHSWRDSRTHGSELSGPAICQKFVASLTPSARK